MTLEEILAICVEKGYKHSYDTRSERFDVNIILNDIKYKQTILILSVFNDDNSSCICTYYKDGEFEKAFRERTTKSIVKEYLINHK